MGSIDRIHEQGSLELTGQGSDLALMGRGYFMVDDGGRNLYTRNGAFTFNALGTLVDAGGRTVLGQTAGPDGSFGPLSEYGAITLPLGMKEEAQATRQVRFRSNLDADASESVASLLPGNTANASTVSGMAADGVGGTLTVTVTNTLARGTQATPRSAADLSQPLSTWITDPAQLDGLTSTRTEYRSQKFQYAARRHNQRNQNPLARGRHHKRGALRVLSRNRPHDAPLPPRPARHDGPLSQRDPREIILSMERPRGGPLVDPHLPRPK